MKNKISYCYLVFCNKEPIVYAVYKSKNRAKKYAESLIDFRKLKAEENGYNFDFYHYFDLDIENKKRKQNREKAYKEHDFEKFHHKNIFSACLSIKDDKEIKMMDDGCFVKIERYRLK